MSLSRPSYVSGRGGSFETGLTTRARLGGEDLARSLEEFTRAWELDGSLLEALFNKSLALQELAMPREAKESWRLYLQKDTSSPWADEARKYGVHFDQHDNRYARTSEWLDVVNGCWSQQHFTHAGPFYTVEDNVLSPKPIASPRPATRRGLSAYSAACAPLPTNK